MDVLDKPHDAGLDPAREEILAPLFVPAIVGAGMPFIIGNDARCTGALDVCCPRGKGMQPRGDFRRIVATRQQHQRTGFLAAPLAALHQKIDINRAGGIAIEAIFERVVQIIEMEMFRAAFVRTIEKRTMLAWFVHSSFASPQSPVKFIGDSPRKA